MSPGHQKKTNLNPPAADEQVPAPLTQDEQTPPVDSASTRWVVLATVAFWAVLIAALITHC